MGEIVRQAAGILESDTPGTAWDKLRSLLSEPPDARFIASRVAQAIGLRPGVASVEEIAHATRRFVEVLAREVPVVLVFDDIQWAEPALLDLIAAFPRLVVTSQVFVLCLARPELTDEHLGWPAPLVVRPLADGESQALVVQLVGENGLDQSSARRVVLAGQGNPLFVEELVAFLQEEVSAQGPEGDHAVAGQEVALPPSLGAVLAARLDALEQSARAWLEAGSVEGEVFHARATEAMLSAPETASEAAELAAARRFVEPTTPLLPSESAFRFHHLLMRDAAYHATAKRARANLHERFADWLESVVQERLPEYQEIVAHHLEQACGYLGELGPVNDSQLRLAGRAAAHLQPAAERALARSDQAAAARLLERLASLLPERAAERPGVLVDLAFCLVGSGRLREAAVALESAASCAAATSDVVNGWRATLEQVWLDGLLGRYPLQRQVDVAEKAVAALEPLGAGRALSRAWRLSGDSLYNLGRCQAGVAAYQEAAGVAVACGDQGQEILALQQLMVALVPGPMPAKAAIELCRDLVGRDPDNLLLQASAQTSVGVHLAMQNRFDEARKELAGSRRILTDLGPSPLPSQRCFLLHRLR